MYLLLCDVMTPFSKGDLLCLANWDGIHDHETGILMYTWTVGSSPCDEDIHPHRDPHSHLFDESEWTHQAVAYPLNLKGKPARKPRYRNATETLQKLRVRTEKGLNQHTK